MFIYRDIGNITEDSQEDIMSVVVDEPEVAVNALTTLYLLKKSANRIDGITKLQKLTFITQNDFFNNDIAVISGEFFKWHYGPMSDEVYSTNNFLVENGLVNDRLLKVTDRGEKILDDFSYLIESNETIFEIVDECVEKFSSMNLPKLKEIIYSMVVIPENSDTPVEIRDIPRGTTIFRNKGFASLNIDDEDIESLEICLDEEMYQSVMLGVEDARSGRISKLEAV